jgi:hypothetical protein
MRHYMFVANIAIKIFFMACITYASLFACVKSLSFQPLDAVITILCILFFGGLAILFFVQDIRDSVYAYKIYKSCIQSKKIK